MTYEKKTIRAITVEPSATLPSSPPSRNVPGTKSSHGKYD